MAFWQDCLTHSDCAFWGALQWLFHSAVNDPNDEASTPFIAQLFQDQPGNLTVRKLSLEKGHDSEELLGKKGLGWTQ